MPTEQQLLGTSLYSLLPDVAGQAWKAGQQLTISDRKVYTLSFRIYRVGSPGGTINFTIRKLTGAGFGDSIASKSIGNANDIADTATWYEATLDTPVTVNEEVRILVEPTNGTSGNGVIVRFRGSDVKANEYSALYNDAIPGWDPDQTPYDTAYKYTYDITAPTVTTQAVTDIAWAMATGNGNITAIGDTSVTQHGHCWSTSANPTTADSKTENGAASAGAFTSAMTGLAANTLYHVRAYATNDGGTSYGADVEFTTLVLSVSASRASFIPQVILIQ